MQATNPMSLRPLPDGCVQKPAPRANVAPFRRSAALVRLRDASIKVDIDAPRSINLLPAPTGAQPL